MKYTKLPEIPEQHITKLEDRGLSIPDKVKAKEILLSVGYYRLSAYTLPFETPVNGTSRGHQFITGTTFDNIVDLYFFDRKLRLTVLDAIEKVEVALRAAWADILSIETNDPHAHTKSANFSDPWTHLQQLSFTVREYPNKLVKKEPFVSHYLDNDDDPFIPHIWAIVETMTFGTLSKWVKATGSERMKKKMAKRLGLPSHEVLESVLHALTPIRNACAHHSRLWNRHFVVRFPKMKNLKNSLQPNNNQQKTDLRIYNALVFLSHIVSKINPHSSWQKRLFTLLDEQPADRLTAMGFPVDWKSRNIWKTVALNAQNGGN